MFCFQNSIWTRNFFYKNRNEKYVFRKLKRTSNRKWKLYSIQLSIAIQIECIITLSRIVQHRKLIKIWKSKKFSDKIARTSYFNAIKNLQHTAIDFNHSISLLFSATNVNHFKLSTIHSNNSKSKNVKTIEKVCASFRNIHAKWIFYIQIIEKQRENNDFDRSVFFAEYQESKYQDIFKNWSNDDFNKKHIRIFCSENHMTTFTEARNCKIAWWSQ